MGLSRDRAAKLEERSDCTSSGAPATVHENPGERCTPGRTHNRIGSTNHPQALTILPLSSFGREKTYINQFVLKTAAIIHCKICDTRR